MTSLGSSPSQPWDLLDPCATSSHPIQHVRKSPWNARETSQSPSPARALEHKASAWPLPTALMEEREAGQEKGRPCGPGRGGLRTLPQKHGLAEATVGALRCTRRLRIALTGAGVDPVPQEDSERSGARTAHPSGLDSEMPAVLSKLGSSKLCDAFLVFSSFSPVKIYFKTFLCQDQSSRRVSDKKQGWG